VADGHIDGWTVWITPDKQIAPIAKVEIRYPD
jgi:hypothetical protein